jgi:hypothetical protein
MNIELLLTDEFKRAFADYFYLIDNSYPEKGSLKIVGDRYDLKSELRTILYRGICSSKNSLERSKRVTDRPVDFLVIDGYNVLFTLLNYRLGRFVFISTDNLCRDAGSLFGKIKEERLFTECASTLVGYLLTFDAISVIIYLDSPVSFSNEHKLILNNLLAHNKINGQVEVVKSADYAVKQHPDSMIASSDSALIDSCSNKIMDIPRQIIERKYKANLFNLYLALQKIQQKN